MSLSIKSGPRRAKVNGLRAEITLAIFIATFVYAEYEFECVITECTGAKHGYASIHYLGLAVDLRTNNIPDQKTKLKIRNEVKKRLGDQYDVILEKDHLHIEYQPKTD